MKLTDVDALRDSFDVAYKCEDCKRDPRYCGTDLFDNCVFTARMICDELDDAPIIEAIPIEWLLKKREEYAKREFGKLTVLAVDRVLWRWYEEKEKENENAD